MAALSVLGISVVDFDQQMGAAHWVHKSKCALLLFLQLVASFWSEKEKKQGEKHDINGTPNHGFSMKHWFRTLLNKKLIHRGF